MKRVWMVPVVATVAVLSVTLTGCQKEEEKMAPAEVMQQKTEEAMPAAKPEAQKPKDHPAH